MAPHPLKKHIKVHEGKLRYSYPCPHCESGFHVEHKFRQHLVFAHNSGIDDQKAIIGVAPGKNITGSETPVGTDGKLSPVEDGSISPMGEPDGGVITQEGSPGKPYSVECLHPGCHASFTDMGKYTAHRRKHIAHEPFECEFCEASYIDHSSLVAHRHTAHRTVLCSICKISCTRRDVRRHQATHTGNETRGKNMFSTLQMFHCTRANCGALFTEKKNLEAHKRRAHAGGTGPHNEAEIHI